MDRRPKVSVVVPNYNYARFLPARIESVLNQTYENYELILLDDASQDGSLEILRQYSDNAHVSVLDVNSSNSGSPFIQWQKGISLAQGEYIWLAESDDWADPEFLETAVSLLDQHPRAIFCFLGSYCIDEDGNRMKTDFDRWSSRQQSNPSGFSVFNGLDYILHNLYWRNYIYNASGVLFRKEAFNNVSDLSCFNMRYCGDWLFWIEMARQGEVVEVYKKMNCFRQHSSSTTVKSNTQGKGVYEDMQVVAAVEKMIPTMGRYKRFLRHGAFYKDIKRLRTDSQIKDELLSHLKKTFAAGYGSYLIERLNKMVSHLFPWVLTKDSDRLK